ARSPWGAHPSRSRTSRLSAAWCGIIVTTIRRQPCSSSRSPTAQLSTTLRTKGACTRDSAYPSTGSSTWSLTRMTTTVSSKGQILLLPRGKRRTSLERWFDSGVQGLRCLTWEAGTGLRWAELLATLRASGRAMPVKDSLIAATALVHGLIVATRNRADFEKARVKIVDPFGA